MINLTRLGNFINKRYKIKINIYAYLNTREFKTALYMLDKEVDFENFVYLLVFPETQEFKIGSTHNMKARYKRTIRQNNLKALVQVDNALQTENELREEMKQYYDTVPRKKDYFSYDTLDNALLCFDAITNKHKMDIKKAKSKLLDFSRTNAYYFRGIYGYSPIAALIIHKYLRNNADLPNWRFLLNVHDREIPNTTLNVMKDRDTNANYYFWFFHGYIVITDSNEPFFNASRIVNSVSRIDNNKHVLTKFLKGNKHFKALRKEFKDHMGFDGVQDRTNLSEAKLKGIYIHEYLIGSILRWLSPRYELMTNIMIQELAKIIDSSAPTQEKINKIEAILRIQRLSDVGNVKMTIPKNEFNIHDYVDPRLLPMFGGGKTMEELESKIEFIR